MVCSKCTLVTFSGLSAVTLALAQPKWSPLLLSLFLLGGSELSLAIQDVHHRSASVQQGAPLWGLYGIQQDGQLILQFLNCVLHTLQGTGVNGSALTVCHVKFKV